MLNHKLPKIHTVKSVQWRRHIKHYFLKVVFFLKENTLFIDIAIKHLQYITMHPITQLIIFKLLIVPHRIIILSSFQKNKHKQNLIYEIFNSYILLNSFTEKLAFSGNGEGILRRQKAGTPKSLTICLRTILYKSLAIKSCHMYKVLISLANYCHDFSISAWLLPYSRYMVLIYIK